jgi:coproporphyrinogen III oxidase-like Fe-S oxidoreductase
MPNFDAYLRNVQSKEHVYPPLELYQPIGPDQVLQAWGDLAAKQPSHPLGIYVHLPFCERKCTFCYCDTIITDDEGTHQAYVDALLAEIDLVSPALSGTQVRSLYLGGGTPTYLSVDRLSQLFDALFARFHFSPAPGLNAAFVNVEGTPKSMTREMAQLLGSVGTDRVTLGIQSNDPAILARVNRSQSFEQVVNAVTWLRDAGVSYINFDLVAGLEGDTVAGFEANLARLLALKPDMVHAYPFSPRGGVAPSPDLEAIKKLAQDMLVDAGLRSTKNDGHGTGPAARNLQVIDKIENAASCLGLGIRSRSHVFSRLAYRSTTMADYLAAGAAGRPPQYIGTRVTRNAQVQKYLMDNLKQGADEKRFKAAFGLPLLPVLEKKFPEVGPLLRRTEQGLRLTDEYRAGHKANGLFFDPGYRQRLFSAFIKQPRGVPDVLPTWEPDLNWMRFLALRLTRSNVYPPLPDKQPMTAVDLEDIWRQHTRRVVAGEVLDKNGIYVHVPYCAVKCNFCFCYTSGGEGQDEINSYADALERQFRRMGKAVDGLRFNSVYFGGGTPTIFRPERLDQLLTVLFDNFELQPGHQFNVEGTPTTLARGRLDVLIKHGLNRLTMGIQALNREVLDAINRPQQTADGVEKVFFHARNAGVKAINLDLMTGLPDQTFDIFKEDIDRVLVWRPDVLHVYPFTNTAETLLWQQGWRMNEEQAEERAQMMAYANDAIRKAGYLEVKNESWCLREDARNIQETDKIEYVSSVLAMGYQARGHVFCGASYGSVPEKYKAFMADPEQVDVYYSHRLSTSDDMEKFIIANLPRGIDRVLFHDLFGQDVLDSYWPQFAWMLKQGLVTITRTEIVSHIKRSLDHIVYAKLFFAKRYLETLREHFGEQYDPDVDWQKRLEVSVDRNFGG